LGTNLAVVSPHGTVGSLAYSQTNFLSGIFYLPRRRSTSDLRCESANRSPPLSFPAASASRMSSSSRSTRARNSSTKLRLILPSASARSFAASDVPPIRSRRAIMTRCSIPERACYQKFDCSRFPAASNQSSPAARPRPVAPSPLPKFVNVDLAWPETAKSPYIQRYDRYLYAVLANPIPRSTPHIWPTTKRETSLSQSLGNFITRSARADRLWIPNFS